MNYEERKAERQKENLERFEGKILKDIKEDI